MKFAWKLFLGITVFYGAITVVYAMLAHEVVGITALGSRSSSGITSGSLIVDWARNHKIGCKPRSMKVLGNLDSLALVPGGRCP